MQIKTTRFGQLEIDDNKIITFSNGIPGFKHLHRFFILPAGEKPDIHWLQAVDQPEVALLVIDPFKHFHGYSVNIPENDLNELKIESPSEALVLVTITVPRDKPQETTANLVAPIIINTRLNTARQVILSGSPYKTKHRLFQDNTQTAGTSTEKRKVSCGEGE